MRKRLRLSVWMVSGVIAALMASLGLWETRLVVGEEKLNLGLGWVPYGRDVGFFAALDRGYFKRERIDAALQRGFGGTKNIEVLATGGVDFHLGCDSPSLMVGRSRGLKVKLVGMFHHRSPYAIYALKGSGVSTPKDLEGRRLGASPGDATRILFPALAKINKIDENKVNWVLVMPPAKVPALVTGEVDAVLAFTSNGPQYRQAAKEVGKEVVEILYKDWGVDIYSMGFAGTEKTIAEKPDLIRRILRATYEGVAWAVEHPEEAVGLFLRRHPEQTRGPVAEGWEDAMGHLLTPTVMEKGLGYITREKMTFTRDIVTALLNLPKLPIEEIYTNEFLPGIIPKVRK